MEEDGRKETTALKITTSFPILEIEMFQEIKVQSQLFGPRAVGCGDILELGSVGNLYLYRPK